MSKILIILASFLMLFPYCGLWGKDNEKPHNETQTETIHHEPEAQKSPLNHLEIIYDKTSNGDRTIRTNEILSAGFLYLGMEVVKHSDGKLSWSLLISDLFVAPKSGGRMLIKLDDGDVIELKGKYTTSAASIRSYTKKVENYIYPITENYIKKIASRNVTKVRIETSEKTRDYDDIDLTRWKKADDITFFSDVVAAEYKALLKALDSKKDFYSDF